VKTLGKSSSENKLYGYLYFPRSEFRTFLEALSELVRSGFLESYQYVIQDLNNSARETIPFQCFSNGKWIYNHKEYINILRKFVKGKQPVEKLPAHKVHTKIENSVFQMSPHATDF